MPNSKIKFGLIGFGYWGPNIARNIQENPLLELTAIADVKEERRKLAKQLYPKTQLVSNIEELLMSSIDAVVVATNVGFHYEIALKALQNGKHVLLEKPGTNSFQQLLELTKVAQENKLLLMIDYTFLYNGAVKKLKELVNHPSFGKIMYIDSTRINLGIFQSEVNVIWDLAVHDISIINTILGVYPKSVTATGISHLRNEIENIAYILLKYKEEDLIVHVNCSWTSPVKIRQLLVGGTNQMIVYNDLEPTDKLRVYDFDFSNFDKKLKEKVLIDYRLGDISVPKFNTTEPLKLLIEDFSDKIIKAEESHFNYDKALKVTAILEACQQSIKTGEEVEINYH